MKVLHRRESKPVTVRLGWERGLESFTVALVATGKDTSLKMQSLVGG